MGKEFTHHRKKRPNTIQLTAPLEKEQQPGARWGDSGVISNIFFLTKQSLSIAMECRLVRISDPSKITAWLTGISAYSFESVVNLYKVGPGSILAMKQIFPGFITEMFPTSSDRKHKIQRFSRLTTVIMAVHNRVNPMNNVLYLAEVRQLVVSGSNKILLVSSDTYHF